MADAIETNLVSRRRIQFELNQQSQQSKTPQQPRVADADPLQDHMAAQLQHKNGGGTMQHSGAPPVLMEEPSLMLAYAQSPPNGMRLSNSGKEPFTFMDYSGCFTDDGSPLIEQRGLSEPLLKRDRHPPPAHSSITAPSPQKEFSLVSQQLLLEQHQLQQQLAQQQQHLQKLNVSLQDTATSRGSSNGHELSTQLALAAVSSPSSAVAKHGSTQQQHHNLPAQQSLRATSDGNETHAYVSLPSSPPSSSGGLPLHAQQQPHLSPGVAAGQELDAKASPVASTDSPQLGPSNLSQLEVLIVFDVCNKIECGAGHCLALVSHQATAGGHASLLTVS